MVQERLLFLNMTFQQHADSPAILSDIDVGMVSSLLADELTLAQVTLMHASINLMRNEGPPAREKPGPTYLIYLKNATNGPLVI